MQENERFDKPRGCFWGLIVGDALCSPREFKKRGTFEVPKVMEQNDVFDVPAGSFTDDSSLALCIADQLIKDNQFDARNQLINYSKWFRNGYLSSTGYCFDIGTTTARSIRDFEQTGQIVSSLTDSVYSGNGGIMRLAPMVIYFKDRSFEEVIKLCVESSKTTHPSQLCVEASIILGGVLYMLLNGCEKKDIQEQVQIKIKPLVVSKEYTDVLDFKFLEKTVDQIKSSGYVVESLEAAMWAFFTTENYMDAITKVCALGLDTDTNAAICGQMAGACYGMGQNKGVPIDLVNSVSQKKMVYDIIEDLIK